MRIEKFLEYKGDCNGKLLEKRRKQYRNTKY